MKKNSHILSGKRGESIACEFLLSKGYVIERTNWRFSKAEIDIIARDGPVLVFIEVKTRSREDFGAPEAFIDKKKESLIADAASQYMEEVEHKWAFRFDFISVILDKSGFKKIDHYMDAFFPGI